MKILTITNFLVSMVAAAEGSTKFSGNFFSTTKSTREQRSSWIQQLSPYHENHHRHNAWIFINLLRAGAITGAQSSRDESKDLRTSLAKLMTADPFVQAAPLILAMVCPYDGTVAMVACHTQGQKGLEEPLLHSTIGAVGGDGSGGGGGDGDPLNTTDLNLYSITEIPMDFFGGPYRIQSLTNQLVLISAGWRADCDLIYDAAQRMMQQEVEQLGDCPADILATQLSLHLAQRAASEELRTLSCASMIISTVCGNDGASGVIWLTDVTGAYPVRALALGNGAAIANVLLSQLKTPARDGRQGLRQLLQVLTQTLRQQDEEGGGGGAATNKWARVEMAILYPPVAGLKRMSLQDILKPEEIERNESLAMN